MPRRLLVSFLLLLASCLAADDIRHYLYRSLENDGGSPIIDYYTPGEPNDHPEFLSQEDFPHHRVVEFYSHTCPHCQKFAPHYIEFGKKFEELTQQHSTGHYANLTVQFYAISCFVHRNICKEQKITGYPTVKIFKADSNVGKKLRYYELHPETLVKNLGIEAVNDNWFAGKKTTNAESPKTQQPAAEGEEKPAFMARRSEELFVDAYLSFHTAMKTAVFLDESNKLGEEKEKTLRNFLTLLERVLPPWRIHNLLESLLGGVERDFKKSIKTEDKWMAILDQHPPQTTEYSPACELHDSPYTCGLWTLFHIMTVGVVEFNSRIINAQANKFVILKLQSVSDLLRFFVQYFLLCEECTNHFLQEYDACSYDRCNRLPPKEITGALNNWKQLPFWLLETHNGVNVRLQAERADGAKMSAGQQQSVMWPPVSDCPQCWLQQNGADSAKRYNETMMYDYLRLTYWPEDTYSKLAKEELLRLQSPLANDPNHETAGKADVSGDDNGSAASVKAISSEMQYTLLLVLLVVIVVWNKRRIRQKLSARTQ